MVGYDNTERIRLNPDSKNDLNCESIFDEDNNFISKKCFVPKSHFDGKNSGYYYIYHRNHLDELIIFYEVNPIQVVLPNDNEIIMRILKEENKGRIRVGINGTFILITNYNSEEIFIDDKLKNEEIKFSSKITDENLNEYDVY